MRKATALLALNLAALPLVLSACSDPSASNRSKEVTFVDENGICYDLYSDGWHITDYRGKDKNIRIPATKTHESETHDVVAIADNAFYGRETLEAIDLPNTITSIGESAFFGTSLQTLNITTNLTHIGTGAFDQTPFEEKAENGILYLPSTENPYCAAYSQGTRDQRISINYPKGLQIAYDSVFENVTFTSIPDFASLLYVGKHAFAEVQFGETLQLDLPLCASIGEGAFLNCTFIETLQTSDALRSIGEEAFSGASSLQKASLGKNVESMGRGVFYRCSGLAYLTLPFVGEKAAEPVSLNNFVSGNAFQSLEVLGGSLVSNFLGGSSADELRLHVSTFPKDALMGLVEVNSLYLLDGVKSVESSACYMVNLSDVFLARSVSSVGTDAFYTSHPLVINCERDANEVENYGFMDGLSVDTARLGEQTTVRFGVDPESPAERISPDGNWKYYLNNGTPFVTQYIGKGTTASLPETLDDEEVTHIEATAFENAAQVREVVFPLRMDFPSGVLAPLEKLESLSIAADSFSARLWGERKTDSTYQVTHHLLNSSLFADYYIPLSLRQLTLLECPNGGIEAEAAKDFYTLEKLVLPGPEDPYNRVSIGDRAFRGCSGLKSVYLPALRGVGSEAFYGLDQNATIYVNSANDTTKWGLLWTNAKVVTVDTKPNGI